MICGSTTAQLSSPPVLTLTPPAGAAVAPAAEIAATATEKTAQLPLHIGSNRSASKSNKVRAVYFASTPGRGTVKADGKVAPKTEPSYYVASLTDNAEEVANIEDAKGIRGSARHQIRAFAWEMLKSEGLCFDNLPSVLSMLAISSV